MKNLVTIKWVLLSAVVFTFNVQAQNQRHEFANDVKSFHEVLSPLWHSKIASPQREMRACESAKALDRSARKIKSVYSQGLRDATKAFRKQCKKDAAQSSASFTALHDAFHHLIDHRK